MTLAGVDNPAAARTPIAVDAPSRPDPTPAAARLSETDLAELLTSFNELTARMQRSHEALTGEVSRLKGELSRASEQLRRSERLAAIGHMAAGIAHEIRNPLASIQLYGEILEKDLAGQEALQALATRIRTAVQSLDAIVRDVLAFAREVTVRPAELLVAEVLAAALADCRGVLHAARVEVPPPLIQPEHCTVVADPSLLRVVLGNIIRNAADAMAEAGDQTEHRLDISANAVRHDEVGDAIQIRFRDTGPGVPPEVRERMFNPFFTTRAAGTGLGLAIVHRILEAHDAAIEVAEREPGERGAEIIITLPLAGRAQCTETNG